MDVWHIDMWHMDMWYPGKYETFTVYDAGPTLIHPWVNNDSRCLQGKETCFNVWQTCGPTLKQHWINLAYLDMIDRYEKYDVFT